MCGFVISIGNFSETELRQATQSISHRGPDDTQFYFDNRFKIKIGFNRLSIIDIDNGRQPFRSEDGNYVIAYNGEIYNAADLRKQLELNSVKFKTKNSDTEVFLKGYQFWGKSIFKKVDGMFAVAIIDYNKKKIIIARDKFGEKPIYYSRQKNGLLIGSELHIYQHFKDTNISLDYFSLKRYFIFSYVPAPNTIYKNIFKVKNSYYHEFNLTNFEQQKFRYNNFFEINNSKIKGEPVDVLDDLLRESVKSRLVTDQKIGLFLSGGIDSALIACYAKQLNQDIESYTVSVKGETFDEIQKARNLSSYLNIKNHSVDLDKDKFANISDNILSKIDEPLGAPTFIPLYTVSKLASDNVKSVLSGDGGDEIFGGYEIFRYLKIFNLFKFFLNKKTSSLLELLLFFLPVSKKNLSLDFKIRRYIRGIKFPEAYRNTMFLSPISINELEEIFNEKIIIEDFFKDLQTFDEEHSKLNYFDKTLMYYVQYYLPDLVCARADRAGMLNSLEIRSPFLNPKILNFVLSRPSEEKADIFKAKKLLKNLLKRKLSNTYIDPKKTGFTFPIQSWLDVNKIQKLELLNSEKLFEMKKKHLNGKTEYRNFFYCLKALTNLKIQV